MFALRPKLAATAASLVALCLLVASTAYAQGFYYKEIEKDGRIYVFNNGDRGRPFREDR